MKNIASYLDATYLKTPAEAETSEDKNTQKNTECITESIRYNVKCVMLRSEYIPLAREIIDHQNASVLVGTVIDFPKGDSSVQDKLSEARKALEAGADELDFVIDYNAFINGDIIKIKEEFITGTKLVLSKSKTIKWIIESAALTDIQITEICNLLRDWALEYFENQTDRIFVKSSTGYYKGGDYNNPTGATPKSIAIMIQSSNPLPVKASGGIRTRKQAIEYVDMGVQRIGASSVKTILEETT